MTLEGKIQDIYRSKEDLINFYFQNPKNIRQNQLLRSKRVELALIVCEEILASSLTPDGMTLISFDKNKVEIEKIASHQDFLKKIKMPEFYMIVGKFNYIDEEFTPAEDNRFYLEVVGSGYMIGKSNPFVIEDDKIFHLRKEVA